MHLVKDLLWSCVLLALWAAFPGQAAAQIYQYTDRNGNIVFSDSPPQGANAAEKKLKDDGVFWSSRGEADIPVAESKGAGKAVAAEDVKKPDYSGVTVVMYRTNWCGYCTKAAAYVRSLGAGIVEYDIDADKDKRAEMKKKSGGSTAVPLLDIDGAIIRGYSPTAIKAAVEKSAAR
jgi:glutaredoxin